MSLLAPLAFQTECLRHTRPGREDLGGMIGYNQLAEFGSPPVSPIDGLRSPVCWYGVSRMEEGFDGTVERRLVAFHHQKVIAPRLQDLLAEGALAVLGIPGQHPTVPVQRRQHRRRNRQFSLCLLGSLLDRCLAEDGPLLGTKGGQGMHDRATRLKGESATLRLAIDRDTLLPTGPLSSLVEDHLQGAGERLWIKSAEEPMQG